MNGRRSVTAARHTRSQIVRHAMSVASVEGLEGLTIGRLAQDLGLSKSGLLGHFGDKQTLQQRVVEAAGAQFWREVWEPVAATAAGLPRLRAVCRSWIAYLSSDALPGGCFFMAVVTEFDDRPGPVREAIVGYAARWHHELRREAERAVSTGELPAGTDPDQLLFEVTGAMLALNAGRRLHRDPTAAGRAAQVVHRLLQAP